ncbi:hypothetical protein BKA70DRAFT_1370571 [Coprinopsis sp. MPI-PUGE-AT-0042]|nr:hypothetical protein BKA70DRAFT_1370571 [Coprinopsis sp. MPI-PUGE-AT-0042]
MIRNHVCVNSCTNTFAVFKGLARARHYSRVSTAFSSRVVVEPEACSKSPGEQEVPNTTHPHEAIIREWQIATSTENVLRVPCAKLLHWVSPDKIDLALLRNDELPSQVIPVAYDFHLYKRAILCVEGMKEPFRLADIASRMPRFALCNWLYYGKDALPPTISKAFRESTQLEHGLICRGRSNIICWRFTLAGSAATSTSDNVKEAPVWKETRKGIKGNVIVSPLDIMQLNEYLPPSPERIRDTMCVLVLNAGVKPTKDTIEKLYPILVKKTRIKSLIEFLLDNNPHYGAVSGFKGYSDAYLNSLFQEVEAISGIPRMVSVAYLSSDDAIEGAASGYIPDSLNGCDVGDDPLLMENNTPMSHSAMKYAAAFLRVHKGSQPIPDFQNPYLLSWLWPHLDPWGIGSFFHPQRKRTISMEEQVAHLLQCNDKAFESDPEFALRAVSSDLRFSAPLQRYTGLLSEKCRADPLYQPSVGHEQDIAKTNIPGSAAQKLSMRNEIRAPTLFITLNPSDKENFIVPLISGHQFATRRPAAFVTIILRYGKKGRGLYAQGRGTLHCHMLKLRTLLSTNDTYAEHLLPWLESIMQADFCVPKDQRPVTVLPRRGRSTLPSGKPHPGRVVGPLINEFPSARFWPEFRSYVDELLEVYMIHVHQTTCWKYLKRGEERTAKNCRMGMTGETRLESKIDTETLEILLKKTHPAMTFFTDPPSCFGASSFMYYVTDYITKASLSMHAGLVALSFSIKKTEARLNRSEGGCYDGEEALKAVTIAVNSMLGHQEMSQQQVMSYLIGGGDHYTSESFQTFNWGEVIRLVKSVWAKADSNEDDAGSDSAQVSLSMLPGTISASNQRIDYTHRPMELESLGLYDFFARIRKTRIKQGASDTSCEVLLFLPGHIQYESHGIVLRASNVIPVLLGPHLSRRENDGEAEDWACEMLALFKPWRQPRDLKCIDETWMESYASFEEMLTAEQRDVIFNMAVLADAREDRKNNPYRSHKGGRRSLDICSDEDSQDANPTEEDIVDPPCSYGLLEDIRNRSEDAHLVQERLNNLIGAIPARDFNVCYSLHLPDSTQSGKSLDVLDIGEGKDLLSCDIHIQYYLRKKQFLMCVCGVGGTGKSYLIRAIVMLFERLRRSHQLLRGAPTGIAAVLIGGTTLHSLIMSGVTGNRRGVNIKLAEMWRGVEWVIVDEVSMVGAVFLANMSARIKIAKGDDVLQRNKPLAVSTWFS